MQIEVSFSMHFSECSENFYDRKFQNCFVGSRSASSPFRPLSEVFLSNELMVSLNTNADDDEFLSVILALN